MMMLVLKGWLSPAETGTTTTLYEMKRFSNAQDSNAINSLVPSISCTRKSILGLILTPDG